MESSCLCQLSDKLRSIHDYIVGNNRENFQAKGVEHAPIRIFFTFCSVIEFN